MVMDSHCAGAVGVGQVEEFDGDGALAVRVLVENVWRAVLQLLEQEHIICDGYGALQLLTGFSLGTIVLSSMNCCHALRRGTIHRRRQRSRWVLGNETHMHTHTCKLG
jgi:hypothetical protein